jgi:DNA-directed RNA polymerase alpha subunit
MKMTVEFNSIADMANFSAFVNQRLEEDAKVRELNQLRGQLDLAKQQLERAYARLRFKDDKDNEKTYAISLDDLPLKVRTYNCLIAEGCQNVGDVVALFQKNQLRKIPNFGNGSFSNLKRVFAEQLKITLDRKQA